MQVTVGNQLRIENPSEQLLTWCKRKLVLPNPEYAKKVRMHFWVGNTPEKLYLFQWDGDTLVLPYGCLNDVLAMDDCHMKINLPTPTEVDFGCTIPLYDYQVEAKEALITAYYGILQAPAGCGKTQIGIAVAADTGRRTLWLTHTRDLLVQSKSRAEQYMSPSLTGTITEGRVQIGKAITFATVQTMCNLDLSQYRDVWDCIIVDECHRVAGTPTAMTQFSKVLNALAARHKYGLSATVHRADGMIAATYALLGGIAYQVPEEAVKDKIMTVSVLPRATHQGLSREFLDTDGTIIYRTTLWKWANGVDSKTLPPESRNLVKKAYQLLNAQMENYMQNGKINPVAGIFLMKNNMGYADKQEVVLTPNQQLGDQVPAEDLEKKYLEDVVGASSDYDSED